MAGDRKWIMCVCTANICRSPMAAKLLEHALKAEDPPWNAIPVISSGVAAINGDRVSLNSVRAMQSVGLDISDHVSTRLSLKIVRSSLAIYCMTESHRHIIQEVFPESDVPIYLLREFLSGTESQQIPDPYGMDLNHYVVCRDTIVEGIPSLVRHLKTHFDPGAPAVSASPVDA